MIIFHFTLALGKARSSAQRVIAIDEGINTSEFGNLDDIIKGKKNVVFMNSVMKQVRANSD